MFLASALAQSLLHSPAQKGHLCPGRRQQSHFSWCHSSTSCSSLAVRRWGIPLVMPGDRFSPWAPLTFCSRAGTVFTKVVSLYGLMGGSLSSAGRDVGEKRPSVVLEKDNDLQTLGEPPRVISHSTTHPIRAPHVAEASAQTCTGLCSESTLPPIPPSLCAHHGVPIAHSGPGALTWLAGRSLWNGGKTPSRPACPAGKQERGYCSVTGLLPCSLWFEGLEDAYAHFSAWTCLP